MGSSFSIDPETVDAAATALTAASRGIGDIDPSVPLAALAAALPGSRTAGCAPDVGVELAASVAVLAGRIGSTASGITASVAEYASEDADGSARLDAQYEGAS